MKKRVFVAAFVLLAVVTILLSGWPERGGKRMPVGKGTPVISLGERHELILASDGSLWTWGSDFLGWPVLGLGTLANQSTILRRIGKENNWVSISAAASHNLAIKSDGTIWTWGESVQARFTLPVPISTPVRAAPGNDWKPQQTNKLRPFDNSLECARLPVNFRMHRRAGRKLKPLRNKLESLV